MNAYKHQSPMAKAINDKTAICYRCKCLECGKSYGMPCSDPTPKSVTATVSGMFAAKNGLCTCTIVPQNPNQCKGFRSK